MNQMGQILKTTHW